MAARDLGPRELAALGERAEALVEAAARILLGRERREVLRALGKAKTVDEMDAILADVLTRYRSRQGIFYRRWLARLLTVDTRLYLEASAAINPGAPPKAGARALPARQARKAATEIVTTSAKRLERLHDRWKAANGTVDDLMAEARSDHLNRRRLVKRAQVIARTEARIMLAGGLHDGAVSGGLTKKRWRHDDRRKVPPARANHVRFHGMTVPIGVPFPNGLQHPHEEGAPAGEVVNCQCTVVYLP